MGYPEMRTAVIGTILVAVLTQSACIDQNRKTSSNTLRAAPVDSGDAEHAKAGEKPPPSIVQPTLVTNTGNTNTRTYLLHIGDAMEGICGDVWALRAVTKDGIVLGDTSEITVPASGGDHRVGKLEYLTVLSLDPEAASVKCELKVAHALEHSGIIEPVKVTSEKHVLVKSKIRLYELKPTKGFKFERDGLIIFFSINGDQLIFFRVGRSSISIDYRGPFMLGADEFMEVTSVTREPPAVEVRTSRGILVPSTTVGLYSLEPGQGFLMAPDNVIAFLGIEGDDLIFQDSFRMPIPIDDRYDRHMGSNENMKIISVTREPPMVEVEVRTDTSPLHILSF